MISGAMDTTRLTCSLCMTPYTIPEFRVEKFFTGIYAIDFTLYNSTAVHIVINYLSLLYGIHMRHEISTTLLLSQLTVYTIYGGLYCWYLRIQNMDVYLRIFLERYAYLYGMIVLYSSYSAFTENYVIMSLTSMFAHAAAWKEHIAILKAVNQELLKND